jgi:hypothetical protein
VHSTDRHLDAEPQHAPADHHRNAKPYQDFHVSAPVHETVVAERAVVAAVPAPVPVDE